MLVRVVYSIDGKRNEGTKRNETGGKSQMYFFLISYPLLGAGLKYIDEAFDEQRFNKKIAYVVAALLGILGAYTMMVSAASASVLLAIVLGVLLKGKVDNKAFWIGLVVTFALIFLAGVQLLIIPLIILTIGALLDEVGNDFIDKKQYLQAGGWRKLVGLFFDQRWVMKCAILMLAGVGMIPFVFFIAMFLFDGAYLSIRWYSQARQQRSVTGRAEKKPESGITVSSSPLYTDAYVGADKLFMEPVGFLPNDEVLHAHNPLLALAGKG